MRLFGKPKAKPWEVMLKVDNLIPLYHCGELGSSNMVSESCPKFSRVNRLVNPQMLNKFPLLGKPNAQCKAPIYITTQTHS